MSECWMVRRRMRAALVAAAYTQRPPPSPSASVGPSLHRLLGFAPASAICSSRLASSSPSHPGSLPILRPSSLKMQSGTGRLRYALRSQKGASDQPCEPSPGDDVLLPKDEFIRIYRESMDKFEKDYSAALRALYGPNQNNMMISEDRLFRKEEDRTFEYKREIDSDKCFLYGDGRQLARILCCKAGQAIDFASTIMAYAGLRAHQPSEISLNTVEQTIRMYVSTFLKIAEDTCHRKANQTTVISFLGALGGLGAISHILFEDALFAANNIEGSLSKYSPNREVGAVHREFQQKMRDLENNFMKASPAEARELLLSTLYDAMAHAHSFIIIAVNCRKDAIAHVLENTGRACDAATPDNREPDASAETGPE